MLSTWFESNIIGRQLHFFLSLLPFMSEINVYYIYQRLMYPTKLKL
jgi:hypothetical protein